MNCNIQLHIHVYTIWSMSWTSKGIKLHHFCHFCISSTCPPLSRWRRNRECNSKLLQTQWILNSSDVFIFINFILINKLLVNLRSEMNTYVYVWWFFLYVIILLKKKRFTQPNPKIKEAYPNIFPHHRNKFLQINQWIQPPIPPLLPQPQDDQHK